MTQHLAPLAAGAGQTGAVESPLRYGSPSYGLGLCPDVDAAYRHLLAHGLQVQEPGVAPCGMRQLYVTDPDGSLVCFQWPAA
jgi:hypothetical protein